MTLTRLVHRNECDREDNTLRNWGDKMEQEAGGRYHKHTVCEIIRFNHRDTFIDENQNELLIPPTDASTKTELLCSYYGVVCLAKHGKNEA